MTMKTNNAEQHKGGKKKTNLNWELIKLKAQVGESTSRRAKKAVEAARKKDGAPEETSEETEKAVAEATQKLEKLKEQKISQKIYQAKKEIKKAFVKAKSFETQRLNKRLKEARKAVENKDANKESTGEETKPALKKKQELTEEDVAKFEHEIELVKKMDMESLSEHAFAAKLAKHPILGPHALMASYVVVDAKTKAKNDKESAVSNGKSDSTTEKSAEESLIQIIEARLTNTKTVKEHMSKLWDELEHIVTGKKVDHEELKKKRKAGNDQTEPEGKRTKTTKDTKAEEESEGSENDNNDDNGDSDEDDGNEDIDMSDFSDEDEERDDGYDSDGLPLPKNAKVTAGSSMFIGSLNAGNSKERKGKKDKNDFVDDKFDEIYGKIKKNRPGQRARRLKAERKFGKEANHVKKAEEEAILREERKAARKAKQEKFKARDASSANSERLPNRRTVGAGDGSAAVHKPAATFKPKAPSGPDLNDPTLHPSWIAKQAEKNAMAAALSGAKSNKITFDDSD